VVGLLPVVTITAIVVVVAVIPTAEVVEIDIQWTVVEIGMAVVVDEEEEEIDLTPVNTETATEAHPITLVAAGIIAPHPREIVTTMIGLEGGHPIEEGTVEIAMEAQIALILVDEEEVALTGTIRMRAVGEMLVVEVETKVAPEALPNTAVVRAVAAHLGVEITIMNMAEGKAEVEAPIMPIDAMSIERIEDIVAIEFAIVLPLVLCV